MAKQTEEHPKISFWAFLLLGMFTGIMSGVFGVGGGFIIVPILLMLGMNQRLAAGTSVIAILPTAVVGAIGYATIGQVDWLAAILLAVGMVAGAQIGGRLLQVLPEAVLFWMFLVCLLLIIPSLFLVIPSRDAHINITVLVGILLVITGLVVGILSALLGVGGGIVMVPILVLLFGANDLIAKGTSLLMMIPGSLSATVINYRHRNVDLKAAAIVGITASVFSPAGIWLAKLITPQQSNFAFSILLIFTVIQLIARRYPYLVRFGKGYKKDTVELDTPDPNTPDPRD